jgi:hypothetical protein
MPVIEIPYLLGILDPWIGASVDFGRMGGGKTGSKLNGSFESAHSYFAVKK